MAARLTPHQRDVRDHYARRLGRMAGASAGYVAIFGRGVRAQYCPGTVRRLDDKGVLRVENRPGPRGGEHLYVVEVVR